MEKKKCTDYEHVENIGKAKDFHERTDYDDYSLTRRGGKASSSIPFPTSAICLSYSIIRRL